MPSIRSREQGPRWSRLAGLLGALTAALLSFTPFLERWELRTQDLRFQTRGSRRTHARILIAAIADSTLQSWEEPMLFWGAHYARAIHQARALGASWIGLDWIQGGSADAYLQRAHGAPVEQLPDRQLALALARGRVVLANARPAGREPINPTETLLFAHPEQMVNLGFVDARPGLDDVVRRAGVFDKDSEGLIPSFPAVLALRARGRSPTDAGALRGLVGARGDGAEPGAIWINYVGPPSSFPYLPLERLATGSLTDVERRWVRGAVVLIGATYAGSNDRHRGPGDADYDGVEIHAHTLATLIDQRPLRRAARGQEALVSVAMGLLAAVAAALLPLGWGLVMVIALGGAWWGISVWAFAADLLCPTAGPWLAIGLAWSSLNLTRAAEEAHRRRWLQGVFGRYVSGEIVEYLLQHPEHLKLGGVERDVSVLFVDIRGYTTFAQGRSPATVMAQLNAFFSIIAPIIDRRHGLVLAYTGDGLLAVFGAPGELEYHAEAAVEAAIEIVQASRSLRGGAQTSSWPDDFRVGCGVHSGLVVCGNLGTPERSAFQVIGDTVNIASRLEELNKSPALNTEFPSELVISQATYDGLRNPPPANGPLPFRLRGREGEVCIYQVSYRSP